jgi:preprotein translocase subunit YajC
MEIVYITLGMWLGILWFYFILFRPLQNKNEKLKEAMHDCIKSGLL